MSANETAAVAEQQEETFAYPIKIEDAGPGTKKVSVDIPPDRISGELQKQFKELRQQAAIPGFRPGHAPQKLIEKRFSSDVKEQVRRTLISESYEQAVKNNNLQVIGEPEFDNPDAIKLPEEGTLTYSFTVEVQPEFAIPDFAGLTVKKPKIEIKDENVDQAMLNLREQQGTLVPVEDRGVENRDYLTADVHLKVDGGIISHQHDAQIVSRPGRIGGIFVEDLDKQLEGLKAGESRTINSKVPETYPNEPLRGKDLQIEVSLKDLKKMELVEVTPEFLNDLGFETEDELRKALREQMEGKINSDIQAAMREQVNKFLLDNTTVELPTKLSDKQADRIISRRAVELMMKGVPKDQVEANVERLRHGAKDEAIRDLKLYFILQKLATDHEVDVDEAELNGRIAMIAAQEGHRPEKLKQDMSKNGGLANLYLQMREQKAIDEVLKKVKIDEVDPTAEAEKAEKKD